MGWAASAWLRTGFTMLLLGIVMIPFNCISKTHPVSGYPQLRYKRIEDVAD